MTWITSASTSCGQYHRFTIPSTDRTAAEAWARKKFDELLRHHERQTGGLAVGVRIGDLLAYSETERLPRLRRGPRS